MKHLILAMAFLPAAASADVNDVVDGHILPGYAQFATQTKQLAAAGCDAPGLKRAYHDTFDAWIAINHIQFGPIEAQGAALKIAYWPDPKGQTAKTLARLIRAEDEAVNDPLAYREVSVAGQGLFALEHLLFDVEASDYTCALTKAVTRGLADTAATLNDAWADHATALRDASEPYQSPAEVQRVLYTALSTGLEFLEAQRLGRPLGTFDRPRPKRAEARRSMRSLRNIVLSLEALQTLAVALADRETPKTQIAFADAITRAPALDDPALQGVADPGERFKIEVLQQKVGAIRVAINDEIGAPLGLRAGFNSLDGD